MTYQKTNRTWISIGFLLILVGSALVFRLSPWFDGRATGSTGFYGTDAYYHLRATQIMAENYPSILTHDPYLSYPQGAQTSWYPLYDFFNATLCWGLSFGSPTRSLIESVCRFLPPIFGALTLFVVYGICRRFGSGYGWLFATVMLCFIPSHVDFTWAGYADHHAAEILLAATLVLVTLKYSHPLYDARSHWISAMKIGLMLSIVQLLWNGGILFGGVLFAWIFAHCLYQIFRFDEIQGWFRYSWLVFLLPGLLSFLFSLNSPWTRAGIFTYYAPSMFTPVCYLFAGMALVILTAPFWLLSSVRFSKPVFVWSLVAGLLVVLTGIVLSMPFIRYELLKGVGYATRNLKDVKAFHSEGLFTRYGVFMPGEAFSRITWLILLSPVFALMVIYKELKEPKTLRGTSFLSVYILIFLLLTLVHKRFEGHLAVAIVCGAGAVITGYIPRKLYQNVCVLAVPVLLFPSINYYFPDGKPAVESYHPRYQSLSTPAIEALDWLKNNTPSPGNLLDPQTEPDYGVFCNWDWGHWVVYLSERPAMLNPFRFAQSWSDGFQQGLAFYLMESEDEVLAFCQTHKIKYIICQSMVLNLDEYSKVAGSGKKITNIRFEKKGNGLSYQYYFDPEFYNLVHTRLLEFDGVETEYGGVHIESLHHFRLIYESTQLINGVRSYVNGIKIFEVVDGKEIKGNFEPGSRVTVGVPVQTITGRQFIWSTRSEVDESGIFRTVIPYFGDTYLARSTRWGSPEIKVE